MPRQKSGRVSRRQELHITGQEWSLDLQNQLADAQQVIATLQRQNELFMAIFDLYSGIAQHMLLHVCPGVVCNFGVVESGVFDGENERAIAQVDLDIIPTPYTPGTVNNEFDSSNGALMYYGGML